MNAKLAATMTEVFIDKATLLPDEHPQWGKDHLHYMVTEIHKMDCPDKPARMERLNPLFDQIVGCNDETQRTALVLQLKDEMNAMSKSTEKAMRWIGWLQACVTLGGGATLEDMKHINMKA